MEHDREPALSAQRLGSSRWLGLFLMGGHPFPFGTIAFGCLFIAVLLHERPSLRAGTTDPESEAASAPG